MATSQPLANPTREIAEFVVRTRIEDLPSDLLSHVRRSTLDCLGVAHRLYRRWAEEQP